MQTELEFRAGLLKEEGVNQKAEFVQYLLGQFGDLESVKGIMGQMGF